MLSSMDEKKRGPVEIVNHNNFSDYHTNLNVSTMPLVFKSLVRSGFFSP